MCLIPADGASDPPWVIEHAVKARLAELRSAQDALDARLAIAREKERKLRTANSTGAFKSGESKKPRLGGARVVVADEKAGDDEFLPEDKDIPQGDGDGVYLSSEVRDLMAK